MIWLESKLRCLGKIQNASGFFELVCVKINSTVISCPLHFYARLKLTPEH